MPLKPAVLEALMDVVEGCKAMVGVCEGFPDIAEEPPVKECMEAASKALDRLERASKAPTNTDQYHTADMPGIHSFCLGDFPHEWYEQHDGDYRRGYYQGWYGAITAIQNGATESSVESFLYGPLMEWRGGDLSKIVSPPEIGANP